MISNSSTTVRALAFSLALSSASGVALAVSTTINAPTIGTLYQTVALTGFQTTGDDMAGLQISVSYDSGLPATATWVNSGAPADGAGEAVSSGNFRLSITGDTYFPDSSALWTLENLSTTRQITEFTISALNGSTMFDIITTHPSNSTTGSSVGLPFEFGAGTTTYSAIVDYTDALKLTSDASPTGDLFLTMRVRLTDGTTPTLLGTGASITFKQDTDSADIEQGQIEVVPEPSTYAAGFAFLGFAGYCLHRRRQAQAK